ncbi:MAG: GC-type dockerin domain-anchored protein, partial [Limnohabitans sp.]|nr:GC-type dockerin domain-anchored protein [Limnohabitans sp.]
ADRLGSVSANGSPEIFFKTDALVASIFNPLVEATATDAASAVRSSYAVMRGVTGSTCTISLKENGPNVGFNGFQIIDEGNDCPADLDGDGLISASDLSALLGAWGTPDADIDGDGVTAASDLSALLASWGACP